jgi:hypothetical protein
MLLSAGARVVGAVVLQGVSAAGLSVLASAPRPVGEVLALAPGAPHPLAGREFPFRVTRCEPLRLIWRIAGAFLAPLGDADLDALALCGPTRRGS